MRITDYLNKSEAPVQPSTKVVVFNEGEYAMRIRKLTASDLLKLRSMPLATQSTVVDMAEMLMSQQKVSSETTEQDTAIENFLDLVVCLGVVAECESVPTQAAVDRVSSAKAQAEAKGLGEDSTVLFELDEFEYKEFKLRVTPHTEETQVFLGDERTIHIETLRQKAPAIYYWVSTEILTLSNFTGALKTDYKSRTR
jgi:uncharacterized protein YqgV (UPF0045/DUF77 family)